HLVIYVYFYSLSLHDALPICLYIGLHFLLHVHQLIVSFAIVSVMVVYATLVTRLPGLRVRLDQAGDNAYYLGLLFTLISMAAALDRKSTRLNSSHVSISYAVF